MSINLMSAIFRTEFRDLQDNEGNTTKASTAKFVCIALADHANDEGEGAYPSINTLSHKTSLSRTAVINALDALKHNRVLTAHGTSKWDTVNYTVNQACFSQDSKPALLVNWVDGGSQPGALPPVNPVDPNHPLTIHKTSELSEKDLEQVNKKFYALISNGKVADNSKVACESFELALFGNLVNWPWDSNSKWQKFTKWVAAQDSALFVQYSEWRKGDGKFHAMSNNKIRQDPQMFIDTGWPTFLAHVSMYKPKDKGFAL